MPWARASSLHRFMECPAASWLPRWDDTTGVTRRGYLQGPAAFGGAALNVLNPALLELKDKRAATLGRLRHAEKESGHLAPEMYTGMDPLGEHELSFSYCCLTGTVRVYRHANEHARNLWKAMQCEHAVTGTADWCGDTGKLLWVDDLKTGWRTPEVLTPQLLFYAMCWSDYRNVAGPVQLSITHQPRGKGVPTRDGLWRKATALMIETFRADLTAAWKVATMIRRPRAGEWCQWCPSTAWCTAALAA